MKKAKAPSAVVSTPATPAQLAYVRRLMAAPHRETWQRLYTALEAVCADPALQGSPAAEFIGYISAIVGDAVTHDSSGQTVLALVREFHSATNTGGRRPNADIYREWLAMFEKRQRTNRTGKSKREIYEDIAADVNEVRAKKGQRTIKWRQIQAGILAAKSAEKKNGV